MSACRGSPLRSIYLHERHAAHAALLRSGSTAAAATAAATPAALPVRVRRRRDLLLPLHMPIAPVDVQDVVGVLVDGPSRPLD